LLVFGPLILQRLHALVDSGLELLQFLRLQAITAVTGGVGYVGAEALDFALVRRLLPRQLLRRFGGRCSRQDLSNSFLRAGRPACEERDGEGGDRQDRSGVAAVLFSEKEIDHRHGLLENQIGLQGAGRFDPL